MAATPHTGALRRQLSYSPDWRNSPVLQKLTRACRDIRVSFVTGNTAELRGREIADIAMSEEAGFDDALFSRMLQRALREYAPLAQEITVVQPTRDTSVSHDDYGSGMILVDPNAQTPQFHNLDGQHYGAAYRTREPVLAARTEKPGTYQLSIPLYNGNDADPYFVVGIKGKKSMFTAGLRNRIKRLAAGAVKGYGHIAALTRDGLTGLYNRTRFNAQLERAFAAAQNGDIDIALLTIDVNNFKKVNDEYGHTTGDEVLTAIGEGLAAAQRSYTDVLGRTGGDEFAVLLRSTEPLASTQHDERLMMDMIAERFQGAARDYVFALEANRHHDLRSKLGENFLSVGYARFNSQYKNVGDLCKASDQAMYATKRATGAGR